MSENPDGNQNKDKGNDGSANAFKESVLARVKRILFRKIPLPIGNASKIHLYEAKERYHSLMNLLEYHARINDIEFPSYVKSETDDDDAYNEGLLNSKITGLREIFSKKQDELKKRIAILTCHKILHDTKKMLTQKPRHLNNLWRALTGVRISLNENIFSNKDIQSMLHFCIEEANRLGVSDDPDIRHWIQRLTELLDSTDEGMIKKFKGINRALLERFNTIRTGRIHQQYVNIRTYLTAVVFLLVVSVPLIINANYFITDPCSNTDKQQDNRSGTEEVVAPAEPATDEQETAKGTEEHWINKSIRFIFKTVKAIPGLINAAIRSLITYNILTFVFVGGLTGGLFSIAMRERPSNRKAGEDAYEIYYVLTKPLVGAIGAVFFYILIQGNFISSDLLPEALDIENMNIKTFGFAFIAGFSERLVFPSFPSASYSRASGKRPARNE
jgi:hypothetical protein